MPSLQFENEAMNCGERKVGRAPSVRPDRRRPLPGIADDIEHVNVRAGRARRRRRHRPDDPASAPGVHDQHPHGDLCRGHRLPLRLLRGRRRRGQGSLDLRPDRSRPARRGRQRLGRRGRAAVPLRRPRRAQVELRRRRARRPHRRAALVYDVSDPTPPVEIANTGGRRSHGRARPTASTTSSTTTPSTPTPPLPPGRGSVARQRQHPARHRGGLRGPRLRDGGLVPDLGQAMDGSDGSIVPLAKVELADLGTYPLPVGAFCSAHWFDYHQSGIVSVGYYGGGPVHRRHRPAAPTSHGLRGSAPRRSGTLLGPGLQLRAWRPARRPISPTPSTWSGPRRARRGRRRRRRGRGPDPVLLPAVARGPTAVADAAPVGLLG